MTFTDSLIRLPTVRPTRSLSFQSQLLVVSNDVYSFECVTLPSPSGSFVAKHWVSMVKSAGKGESYRKQQSTCLLGRWSSRWLKLHARTSFTVP